jgi:hypothetical protein
MKNGIVKITTTHVNEQFGHTYLKEMFIWPMMCIYRYVAATITDSINWSHNKWTQNQPVSSSNADWNDEDFASFRHLLCYLLHPFPSLYSTPYFPLSPSSSSRPSVPEPLVWYLHGAVAMGHDG